MSAIDTYNEKFMICNNLEAELAQLNQEKTVLDSRIVAIDARIAAKTAEKTTVDTEHATAQGILPTDQADYQAKYLLCVKVNNELAALNKRKDNINNVLSEVNSKITAQTAAKVTADTELATAATAL